ncbi:hypothetical protein [Flammeovirga sp. OC4]|uniref:hypothetical protein n=1 Tax=Flammeovirga sp. OC4 TaxID=1382345 RepID=UPI0005C4A8BE|nr:hypothetical protein [Flammeovirga sp. OC4]
MKSTEQQLSDYQSLSIKAEAYINSIKNSPQERLESRKEYYVKYGFADGNQYGFGNSEIDFLEWEVERGVLAEEYHARWWYNVNLKFIYYSVLGSYVFEKKLECKDLPQPVQRWVDYLSNPCSSTWYKAHNTSIIHGYIEYKELAKEESWIEQYFINEVLDRLLYAEVMVEGKTELFGPLGKILANPRLPAVDILVKIKDLYPENYPLKFRDMLNVLDIGFDIGTLISYILDKVIIKRHLKKIYFYISELLEIPELENFIVDNKVNYPQI